MARTPILAAGGIVLRGSGQPRIAVVQRRKDNGWVLPKGKLKISDRCGRRRDFVEQF